MSQPKVYIIILNYKGKSDTLDCLESVHRNGYPAYHVVVVDNASHDGAPEAVRAAWPGDLVVENSENLLYAEGNNVAIRLALEDPEAKYILLLNNDTVVAPDLVSELVKAMEADPAAGLGCPMIYYYPPKPEGRELIWYAGGIVELWKGLTAHRGIRETDTGAYSKVEETGYVTGCAMMIRRSCAERTGLLDPSYGMYAEDADYSLRAARAGFRLLFIPSGRVWHKVSVSAGGEFSWFKLKRKARASLLLLWRYAPAWGWLTIPFFLTARVVGFVVRRLMRRLMR